MSDEGVWCCVLQAKLTYFDVKLHFGDEQFEVDAAQLSIAFAQVTLRMREMLTQEGGNVIKVRGKKKCSYWLVEDNRWEPILCNLRKSLFWLCSKDVAAGEKQCRGQCNCIQEANMDRIKI